MKRLVTTLLFLALAFAVVASAGCQKKIEVQTGTRTVCTYGESISQDVRTIKVPADKAGDYRVITVTKTCDRHRKLEALYGAAQLDLAKNDLAAAKSKLTQVVAGDPNFSHARSQLDQLNAGKKPAVDTGKPGGSKPATSTPVPGGTNPSGPIEALLKWAPDSVSGFTASKPVLDAVSLSRQYEPGSSSSVVSMVIAAEQFRNPSAASTSFGSQVKGRYPRNASTLSVNGHAVYFGTDGRRFAVLGFTQGAVLVVVEMAGEQGGQAGLKDDLIRIAKQLP